MKTRFSKLRAALVGAGAAALVTAGLALPAAAAPGDTTVDPTKDGSITLTKYESKTWTTDQQNGKETAKPTGSEPLNGAKFQLYRLTTPNLDLSTNAGWQALQTFIGKTGPNPTQAKITTEGGALTAVDTEMTTGSGGVDGVIEWANLPLGVYYVEETFTPAGLKGSAPFFITIPMTDPDDRDEWMYDIWVYPKNLDEGTEKIPQDADKPYIVGQELTWRLSATIPGDKDNEVTVLRFTDKLDAALDYVSAKVQVETTPGTWTELTYPGDYTASASGQDVTVTLTQQGLDKIENDELWGKRIAVDIVTLVNDNYGTGAIPNEAEVITNVPGSATETKTKTPKTESKFGNIQINKVDENDDPLQGAKFDVYYSHLANPDFSVKNNAETGIAPVVGTTCDMTSTTFCELKGLRYSDFAEGKQLTNADASYIYYWLVETTAPAKYELLAEPFGFELVGQGKPAGFNSVFDPITVENVKRGGGIQLPFTGGPGTIVFLVAGVALLGGAAAIVASRARKNESAK